MTTTNPPQVKTISIRFLKAAVTSEHVAALLQSDQTHNPTLPLTCQLVPYTTDREHLLSIIQAALPADYSGDTLDQVPEMIESAIAKGFAEGATASGGAKKSAAETALANPTLREVFLFHDEFKKPYATVRSTAGGPLTYAVSSERFRLWVHQQHFEAHDQPLGEKTLDQVIEALAARAIFVGPEETVHLRFAKRGGEIWIDLGDDTGAAVQISRDGYSTAVDHQVRFRRGTGMLPMPTPVAGGNEEELRELLGLDEHNWLRVLAFIMASLRPDGPYFGLLIEGEQGSGKSVLASVIKRIVDPHRLDRIRLPQNDHDLIIQAQESALLNYDNTSRVTNNMSDSLCSLLSRTSFGTRMYYTDDQLRIIDACRPVILNGIGEYARRPDLLDRCIPLNLATREGERKTEEEIQAALTEMLPRLLGALYSAVAHGLRTQESIAFNRDIRMADAARWITATEGAFGLEPGTLAAAVVEGQENLVGDVIVNDPLYIALLRVVKEAPFDGMMSDLHDAVGQVAFGQKGLPATAAHLSNSLRRLAPAVSVLGLHIELANRTQKGREVRIWRDEQDPEKGRSNPWKRPAFM